MASTTIQTPTTIWKRAVGTAPGMALCLVITAISILAERIEVGALGRPYIEALVIAILIGMTVRTFWTPGQAWMTGIAVSAKQLLEVAVMLLGASLSLATIAASGPLLLAIVVATVAVALVFSYGASRMLGLPIKLSILIACGNSICGNSAIAAAAPVIDASSEDVGASISFTAILGVLTVLGLPLLIPLFYLSDRQYGILAGLTVYAVPQVLAATVPIGLASAQIGTLVKLTRVLMLGPVLIGLSLSSRWIHGDAAAVERGASFRWLPWFIPGFLVLSALRSFGLVPDMAVQPLAAIAAFLTIVSMAALGLGVDLKLVGKAGLRVTSAVLLSLALLVSIGLVAIRLF